MFSYALTFLLCVPIASCLDATAPLDPQNPTLTVLHDELPVNSTFTVSVISGLSLDIFIDVLDNNDDENYYFLNTTNLYDGDSTDGGVFVGTLATLKHSSKPSVPRHYQSKSGSLTILRMSDELAFATLFFRVPEIHSANCPNENNVRAQEGAYLQLSSGTAGACMFTILSQSTAFVTPANEFSYLKTNSTENVQVVAEADKNYPLFSFNSSNADSWNTSFIYGKSFSFIIPASSSVQLVYLGSYKSGPVVDSLPAYGIFMTENYGDPGKVVGINNPMDNGTITLPADGVAYFTLKFYNVSRLGRAWFGLKGNLSDITNAALNTIFIFYGHGDIILFVDEVQSGYRGLLFDYVVVHASTVTTTTTLTSTTLTMTPIPVTTGVATQELKSTTTPTHSTDSSTLLDTTPSKSAPKRPLALLLLLSCLGSTITAEILTKFFSPRT